MLLSLLRHGIAEEPNPAKHRGDEDRALTERGKSELEPQARAMARLDLGIDTVLASPYLRAQQTASIVCSALGLQPQSEPSLVPHAEVEQTVAAVSRARISASALLVGHEPHLSALGAHLLGEKRLPIEMQRASLLVIEVNDLRQLLVGSGVLRMLIPAQVLRLAGERL